MVGIGQPLAGFYQWSIPELRAFPDFTNSRVGLPCTQSALWICIVGDDPGVISNRSWELEEKLAPGLERVSLIDGFKYDIGRDLTGYIDGTENPVGEDAVQAAISQQGGSCLAVQKWQHNFNAFNGMTETQQDDAIGRHRISNEEYDAPDSAHVKRTAQESFEPEAFLVRRFHYHGQMPQAVG